MEEIRVCSACGKVWNKGKCYEVEGHVFCEECML